MTGASSPIKIPRPCGCIGRIPRGAGPCIDIPFGAANPDIAGSNPEAFVLVHTSASRFRKAVFEAFRQETVELDLGYPFSFGSSYGKHSLAAVHLAEGQCDVVTVKWAYVTDTEIFYSGDYWTRNVLL